MTWTMWHAQGSMYQTGPDATERVPQSPRQRTIVILRWWRLFAGGNKQAGVSLLQHVFFAGLESKKANQTQHPSYVPGGGGPLTKAAFSDIPLPIASQTTGFGKPLHPFCQEQARSKGRSRPKPARIHGLFGGPADNNFAFKIPRRVLQDTLPPNLAPGRYLQDQFPFGGTPCQIVSCNPC